MTSGLPSDPREREMFLRALREYSERCEPPGLTPDCPFAEPAAPGIMGCGEECMDLLAEHNAPGPRDDFDLGGGMSIARVRRPRARHTRESDAFDARRIFLEEHEAKPLEQQRLTAVLVGLQELVASPPAAGREEAEERRLRVDAAMRCAAQRGLMRETCVEPWLRRLVGGAVFAHLIAAYGAGTPSDFGSAGGWKTLTESHLGPRNVEDSDGFAADAVGSLVQSVFAWAAAADIDAVLAWSAPEARLFESSPGLPSLPLDAQAEWVIERFTNTYLDRWSPASLRLEWLYIHGQQPGPCSPSDMRTRQVDESVLAKEIANRYVEDSPMSLGLAKQLVEPALKFVGEGRRTEASALFEAAIHHEPKSFDALNNLGFCLLPDEPERSLDLFDKAIASGHGENDLARVNRILALAILGRYTSALDSATAYLDRNSSPQQPFAAWLWDINSVLVGSKPQLIDCDDPQDYVKSIQAEIHRMLGTEANGQSPRTTV